MKWNENQIVSHEIINVKSQRLIMNWILCRHTLKIFQLDYDQSDNHLSILSQCHQRERERQISFDFIFKLPLTHSHTESQYRIINSLCFSSRFFIDTCIYWLYPVLKGEKKMKRYWLISSHSFLPKVDLCMYVYVYNVKKGRTLDWSDIRCWMHAVNSFLHAIATSVSDISIYAR